MGILDGIFSMPLAQAVDKVTKSAEAAKLYRQYTHGMTGVAPAPIPAAPLTDDEVERIADASLGGYDWGIRFPKDQITLDRIQTARNVLLQRGVKAQQDKEAKTAKETCCQFCKSWKPFDGVVGLVMGHCRIRAPVVVSSPDGPVTRFPETTGSSVCGEYARRAV